MTERKREMSIARLARRLKRPHRVCVKMAAVAVLGLCFVFFWYFFSSPSSSVTVQRESFDDIVEPVSSTTRAVHTRDESKENEVGRNKGGEKGIVESNLKGKEEKRVNGSVSVSVIEHESRKKKEKVVSHRKKEKLKPVEEKLNEGNEENQELEESESESESGETQKEEEDDGIVTNGEEQESNGDGDGDGDGNDLAESVNQESEEKIEEVTKKGWKRKAKGPVFDPKARYSWKLCNTRSKHNYMPCIDNEGLMGRLRSYRHRERSCPKTSPMCLVPLPRDGYGSSVPWPESKSKILYKNVAHPKLAKYIKKHDWLVESGQYVTFPQNQTEFKGGIQQYLESIEEMVPDIEWGKNVRLVLDIGCSDSSFVATLLDKDVLALSLGLKDDLVDLAQVALERGLPTMVSAFATRRLPFPSGVFDAIHCGACGIPWHSHGGRLLLEMNRVLRPNGYFILSNKHDNIEDDEAMTTLTASICWNILAHKTDEASEMGVKIYQKPESNDIYKLRRKKNPPLCKENENPDAAWYVSIKTCLHAIPSAIEQHGTEWPEEWPKRLETYPDWLNNKEKVIADTDHWKAVVEKSYLTGLGIDWSKIRNVMDMKAIYGGFAAALAKQNVWVMNVVVPVHALDTLPFIYERGLVGIYHDWCESFGTYPRSYDLLHADHLFSRLKNRCKQPVSIVVEMDRVLRPGGWVIVRDKVEILDPLEVILKGLHWEIRMTYAENKEGMLCAQKTLWRP